MQMQVLVCLFHISAICLYAYSYTNQALPRIKNK
jgi:hypothetical protein